MNRVFTLTVILAILAACNAKKTEPAAPPPTAEDVAIEVMGDAAPPSSLLPGAWVSAEDSKYVVTITPDAKYIETYDGTDETTSDITWVSNCADAPVEDAGPYLVVTGDDIVRCFKLVHVDTNNLQMMYVGRGNTLSYTRIHD